jgi:hypothetical protein
MPAGFPPAPGHATSGACPWYAARTIWDMGRDTARGIDGPHRPAHGLAAQGRP